MAKKTDADQKILDLIALAKKKKDAISKAEKPSWKTNCSFRFIPDSGTSFNLQVVSDVDILVGILAFLVAMRDGYSQASNILLGQATEFKWQGFSYDDWRSDLETRAFKIQIKKEKQELEMIEERLSKLISPELRQKLELAELEKMLNK